MPTVTVVPSDKLIIVDSEAIVFDAPIPAPSNLHALQWNGTSGEIEWEDDYNWPLEAEAYEDEVAPYVALWQAEKARREKAAAEEESVRALPDAKTIKQAEIESGYDAALTASLTMPTETPTAQDVAVGAALFAVDDAEGLAFVRETHAARRDELLAAVEVADTVEAVQAIEVSYAV
ncbi:phage tail protein [Desulfovibrio piger]|nr:phage tail protein [Desulfovibrio piger]